MSENEETDLDIAVNYQGCEFDRHKAAAELARLRAEAAKAEELRIDLAELKLRFEMLDIEKDAAEAEAWRAVRERWEQGGQHYGGTCEELQRQIARLDQLTPKAGGE